MNDCGDWLDDTIRKAVTRAGGLPCPRCHSGMLLLYDYNPDCEPPSTCPDCGRMPRICIPDNGRCGEVTS